MQQSAFMARKLNNVLTSGHIIQGWKNLGFVENVLGF